MVRGRLLPDAAILLDLICRVSALDADEDVRSDQEAVLALLADRLAAGALEAEVPDSLSRAGLPLYEWLTLSSQAVGCHGAP